MKILDRYVTWTFVSTFGLVTLFVLGMFVVLDVFALMDDLMDARTNLEAVGRSVPGVLLEYYSVSIPFFLRILLPFITLISATIAVIRLMRGNEIVPMVIAGRSPARIARPIFIAAGLVTLGMIAMQEWGLPAMARSRTKLILLVKGKLEGELDNVPPLIDENGNTWTAELYFPVTQRLQSLAVLRYRDPASGRHLGTLVAQSATWLDEGPGGAGWYPEGGKLYPDRTSPDFGRILDLDPGQPLRTDITAKEVQLEINRDSRDAGQMQSISEAARMARLYPDLPRQGVAFHSLFTWPLANLLLIMLGLPLLFRLGERNMFAGVGVSMGICAGYFAVDRMFLDLGGRGAMNPAFAAWIPVVLSVAIIIAMRD
jgi:lipopolysaccharide export system permease protein